MKKRAKYQTQVCESPWLNSEDAAAYLGLATGTVRNLTWSKKLPSYKRGRIVRYNRDDLDAWLRDGERAIQGTAK